MIACVCQAFVWHVAFRTASFDAVLRLEDILEDCVFDVLLVYYDTRRRFLAALVQSADGPLSDDDFSLLLSGLGDFALEPDPTDDLSRAIAYVYDRAQGYTLQSTLICDYS